MTNPNRSAAEWSIRAGLVLVGVVHLLPLTGVLGTARLCTLYGVTLEGPDVVILMRHRAVLFGIMGILLVAGAVRESLRSAALAVGVASLGSFLLLAVSTGGYNAELARGAFSLSA